MKTIPQMEPWFDKKEARAVYKYMQSGGWVMEFKKTRELEEMICKFTGTKYCVVTVNGTVSLTLGMLALGLKPGDEVLVPDLTMIASPNSAALIGIKPVLVDIEPQTLCMDLKKAGPAISKKTKALMYVPFNGRSGNMNEVVRFCKNNNLYLIEDAAQALGSYYQGRHLGAFGDIGSFSFSVPKIITTGQGGALITDKKSLYLKIKRIKDFGRLKGGSDTHDYWGWNFKFTDIQAVIGIEQMKKLPMRLKRKREIYSRFKKGLASITQVKFLPTNLKDVTPWFIDIYTKHPNSLAIYLKEKGIETRRIYPAIHTQKVYRNFHKGKHFPVAQKFAKRGLWLPSSSKLTDKQVDFIVKAMKQYYIN